MACEAEKQVAERHDRLDEAGDSSLQGLTSMRPFSAGIVLQNMDDISIAYKGPRPRESAQKNDVR